jgi:hypothetical protein
MVVAHDALKKIYGFTIDVRTIDDRQMHELYTLNPSLVGFKNLCGGKSNSDITFLPRV